MEAALNSGRPLDRVIIARGAHNPRIQGLVDACRQARVPVRFDQRQSLDRLSNGAVHQGVLAYAASKKSIRLEDLLENAAEDGLMVVADGVEDPHNLGAIVRSAHAAGAAAVIIPERRAAGVSDTVAKAAAGALEYLPVVRVKNVNRAIEQLKEAGFWIYGLDERGEKAVWEAEFAGKVALVLGAEGAGLHRLTAEKCDFLVRIPMAGEIASLNVSVAAGVALFEVVRQKGRGAGDKGPGAG